MTTVISQILKFNKKTLRFMPATLPWNEFKLALKALSFIS